MGYYTDYKLEVLDPKNLKNKDSEFEEIRESCAKYKEANNDIFKEEFVKKLKNNQMRVSQIDEEIWDELDCDDAKKWYDHENDMKLISTTFHEFLFKLNGEGEESGDIWVKWFYQGKMQGGQAKLILPEFDAKLFGL